MSETLAGVRVLDLSRILAGPYGSMLLADMGAEVIKVEPPGGGEPTREFGPPFWEGSSPYFISVNRNKRSVTLDLKKSEGRELFFELVAVSDVVMSNFRPGIVERLGVAYEDCKAVKPDIIYTLISGYGQDGPYREYAGVDVTVQAGTGGMSITGEPGRPPVRMGIPIGDLGAGMLAATGTCAALYQRAQTGQGQLIDISLFDTQVSLLTYVAQNVIAGQPEPQPIGSEHQTTVPYGAYKAADGYLALGGNAGKFWLTVCDVLGIPELAARYPEPRERIEAREIIRGELEEALQAAPVAHWVDLLRSKGVPVSAVASISDVLNDEHAIARGMVVELDEPDPVLGRHRVLGNPIHMGSTTYRPIPRVGEANEYLYSTILKVEPDRLKRLAEEGVI